MRRSLHKFRVSIFSFTLAHSPEYSRQSSLKLISTFFNRLRALKKGDSRSACPWLFFRRHAGGAKPFLHKFINIQYFIQPLAYQYA